MGCVGHLDKACRVKERNKSIGYAKKFLKLKQYDAIVICGSSGMFGAMLAYELDKPIIIVRKPTDNYRHSFRDVESGVNCAHHYDASSFTEKSEFSLKWIFVDDLIDSGATFANVWKQINKKYPKHKLVGFYSYDYRKFEDGEDLENEFQSQLQDVGLGQDQAEAKDYSASRA